SPRTSNRTTPHTTTRMSNSTTSTRPPVPPNVSFRQLQNRCQAEASKSVNDEKDVDNSVFKCCTSVIVCNCLAINCAKQPYSGLDECIKSELDKRINVTLHDSCNNLQQHDVAYCSALPDKSKLPMIIGVSVGGVLLLVLIIVLVAICIKKQNKS